MKKRTVVNTIAALLVTSGIAWAAGTTLTGLTASGAIADADTFYTVQTPGAGGVKGTALKMYTYIASKLAPVAASGSATDLSAGTLNCARTPALTGNVTTSAGSCATTVAAVPVAALPVGQVNHPGYRASVWQQPLPVSGQGNGATPSLLTAHCGFGQIGGSSSATLAGLSARLTTPGSTNIQLAVYNNDLSSGISRPGTLVANTANIANNVTATVTATFTGVSVSPGFYWFCLQTADTTVRYSIIANTSAMNSMVGSTTATTANAVLLGVSTTTGISSFGTWPSLVGATFAERADGVIPVMTIQFSSVP